METHNSREGIEQHIEQELHNYGAWLLTNPNARPLERRAEKKHRAKTLVEEVLHQEIQKAVDELSKERTGFLDHIAKLEKTHQEELQKAREERDKKVVEAIDKALLTKTEYAEHARGWGAEGSDRYLGYIDGAMDVNGRIFWELAAIGIAPNLGITKDQSELDQPNK